jgi:hypothetical protein
MSHKGYAFINADSIVVQVITGALNPAQQAQFLRDYAVLFGATAIIEVEQGTSVWIGGTYTDGVFAPPPQPEPLPEMIEEPIAMIEEMQPEPLPEPEPEA